jgi:hypothetical protein
MRQIVLISRNSSRMMPDIKSRNSGIFLAEIPEFRDLGKNGISGNPEIGNSGIATSRHAAAMALKTVHRAEALASDNVMQQTITD